MSIRALLAKILQKLDDEHVVTEKQFDIIAKIVLEGFAALEAIHPCGDVEDRLNAMEEKLDKLLDAIGGESGGQAESLNLTFDKPTDT